MSEARPRRGAKGAGRNGRRPAPTGRRAAPTPPPYDEDGVRLQKILADAGLASRREAEELILAGRVKVDGIKVRQLGVRVDPAARRIELDGLEVQTDSTKVVLALNKPSGVVSTMEDPNGRPCLADLVERRRERLFHVGRLDSDSEGLILLTNDGALANALAHPSHEVPKTYLVTVEGRIRPGVGKQLRDGVELEDGFANVDSFRIVDAIPGLTQAEITLHSGKNRIIRRLLKEVGYKVVGLVRTRIGPLALGELKPGHSRVLSSVEIASLKKAARL